MSAVGSVVWLTGLPGAGKTTLGELLRRRLRAAGVPAGIVDGDEARQFFSHDLGFTRADRARSAERLAWVAGRLAGVGAVAIVAAVSPYESDRSRARAVIEQAGFGFVEVHVRAPLAACVERDPKGLYGRALRGELAGVTGLDAPYEPPRSPDVVVDTTTSTPSSCVAVIVDALDRRGIVALASTAVV